MFPWSSVGDGEELAGLTAAIAIFYNLRSVSNPEPLESLVCRILITCFCKQWLLSGKHIPVYRKLDFIKPWDNPKITVEIIPVVRIDQMLHIVLRTKVNMMPMKLNFNLTRFLFSSSSLQLRALSVSSDSVLRFSLSHLKTWSVDRVRHVTTLESSHSVTLYRNTSHSQLSRYVEDIMNSTFDFASGLTPGWHVGRLSEGQYEYDKLNGWMSPG